MPHARPRNTSVHLGDEQRLMEDHETRVKALEAALVEGENSGEPRPFDFDAFKARKRASPHPRTARDGARRGR